MRNKVGAISLRRQLLHWLLTPLVPLLLLGAAAAFYIAYHFVNLTYDRTLLRTALALADQISVEEGRVVVDLPQAAFDMLEFDKDDWIYYEVTDQNGQFVSGYSNFPKPPVPHPLPGQDYHYKSRFDGKNISVVALYLSMEDEGIPGYVLVQVAETTAKRQHMAVELILGTVLPQLFMVLLATFMVWRGVTRGLRPLERLRAEIIARSHRDLGPLSVRDAPSEVVPILGAMNDLMARLAQLLSQQERFTADASHQLRTPLAGLKTQAEIALREQDPARQRQALEQIRDGSGRLSHLVSQLLSLARIEPGAGVTMTTTAVDLIRLAREIAAESVPAALAKEIDLGFESALDQLPIQGEPHLLREMLTNLVDNALRYTPRGGRVTLSVRPADSGAELWVEDNGPGIPAAERARVFERFYRILGSQEEGCGLGLAIVREVAERHGGSARIEAGAGNQGARVVIVLPSAPSFPVA